MTIDLLIPCYRADPSPTALARQLAPTLDSVRGQPGPFQVILALHHPAPTAALRDALGDITLLHERIDPTRRRPASRAAALNIAADRGDGEILLVLHDDLRLPANALAEVRAARRAGYAWGAFWKVYDRATPLLRGQEWWLNRWQLGVKGRPVGTNAVWLARELWEPLPDQRMLEDFHLAARLRRRARPCLSRRPVTVSSAKYLRTGVARSIAINAAVLALHRFGVPADELAERIYSRRGLADGPGFWPSLARAAWRSLRQS